MDDQNTSTTPHQPQTLAEIFEPFLKDSKEFPHYNIYLFEKTYRVLLDYFETKNNLNQTEDKYIQEFESFWGEIIKNPDSIKKLRYNIETYRLYKKDNLNPDIANLQEDLDDRLNKLNDNSSKNIFPINPPLQYFKNFAFTKNLDINILNSIIKTKPASACWTSETINGASVNLETLIYNGINIKYKNSVFHIPGELRIKFNNNKPYKIETSNSALLDLLTTSRVDINNYKITAANQEELLKKLALKARVEEFINNKKELKQLKANVDNEIKNYQPSKFYIFHNDSTGRKNHLVKGAYKSYEDARRKANTWSVTHNEVFIVECAQDKIPAHEDYYKLNQNNINDINTKIFSYLKVEPYFQKDDIVHSKNSPQIIFKKAIHEIAMKEKDLKDSIRYKLFPKDDVINSKLAVLEKLKSAIANKLQPDPKNLSVSVNEIVKEFEKDELNKHVIKKHRYSFFTQHKESDTQKLITHLKSDPEYQLKPK